MSHIPYGYKIKEGVVKINTDEAIKIKALFKHYLVKKSMSAAAKEVGIDKVHSAIGRILSNQKYLGTEHYPQIIDTEVFEKVQLLRAHNAHNQNRIKVIETAKKELVIPNYRISKIERKFDDPYKHAEYVYSHIEEVS